MKTFAEMTEQYEAKARGMTTEAIFYALGDIKETMVIWRDAPAGHPYATKLQAEFDAMVTEWGRRRGSA